MFEAIDFRDFDVQDTPRYLEYVSQCIQIPCMLSPFLHLAFKDEFHTKLGYEAGLSG
ncbi:MAG: hypothetical protein IJS39_00580 [Synergistaceae bacterium]|nr:hypothetical protein [Synergistaceae bacterium]